MSLLYINITILLIIFMVGNKETGHKYTSTGIRNEFGITPPNSIPFVRFSPSVFVFDIELRTGANVAKINSS